MREIRKSGSVGARGEQSPWATRPFSPPSGVVPRLRIIYDIEIDWNLALNDDIMELKTMGTFYFFTIK